MKYRIGDRYQDTQHKDIWECTEDNEWICIDAGITLTVSSLGYKDHNSLIETDSIDWEYLGNFAKQSNFEQLYDLLNS